MVEHISATKPFESLMKKYGITHKVATPYHPQTSGQVEFANIVNFLVFGQLPAHWSTQDKRKFLNEMKNFYWDDPNLFKYCPDKKFQRCIPDNEVSSVLNFVILKHVGVNSHQERRLQKSYKMDFIGPPCSRTCENC